MTVVNLLIITFEVVRFFFLTTILILILKSIAATQYIERLIIVIIPLLSLNSVVPIQQVQAALVGALFFYRIAILFIGVIFLDFGIVNILRVSRVKLVVCVRHQITHVEGVHYVFAPCSYYLSSFSFLVI